MGWRRTEKQGLGRSISNKLTEATSDSPQFVVVINDGGGNESPKLWVRKLFIRGEDWCYGIFVY